MWAWLTRTQKLFSEPRMPEPVPLKCCQNPMNHTFLTKTRKQVSPQHFSMQYKVRGFSDGSVVRNLPADAGDTSPIPDPERSHVLGSN